MDIGHGIYNGFIVERALFNTVTFEERDEHWEVDDGGFNTVLSGDGLQEVSSGS